MNNKEILNAVSYTNHISVDSFIMLRESVGWGTSRPDRVKMALERNDFLTVARIDDREIGMARVIHDGLQALILDVCVLPEYQGRGIGKKLMEQVMDYLEDTSQDGGLLVNLLAAHGKEGFYEPFGFENRPNENNGSGMTKFIGK